ncbi:MAG: NTP transferase domain-containing protein [Phormidesmis sp.]
MPACHSQGHSQSHSQDFAIILAAGFSTRMGVCKTTLPWHNHQTLLHYQTAQFLQANITPIVVLGSHNAHRQVDCAPGSQVVVKPEGDRSKTKTILTGLAHLPENVSTITLSAVDQPRSANVYKALLQTSKQEKSLITAPCYQRKLGHPVVFSHRLLSALKNISDESLGVRKLMQSSSAQIKKVAFSTPEILIDLNDALAYQSERHTETLRGAWKH